MMGRGVKPPPPKALRMVQESEELNNDNDYDVELSFERRPSFSTPVINLIDIRKRATKTVHQALYIIKPKQVKNQALNIIREQEASIQENYSILRKMKEKEENMKKMVRKKRGMVQDQQIQYMEYLKRLQDNQKELGMYLKLHESEKYSLENNIVHPATYTKLAKQAVGSIREDDLFSMKEIFLKHQDYLKLSAKDKKKLKKEKCEPPVDSVCTMTRLAFDVSALVLRRSLPNVSMESIRMSDEDGSLINVDFVKSVYASVMRDWIDCENAEPAGETEQDIGMNESLDCPLATRSNPKIKSWIGNMLHLIDEEEKRTQTLDFSTNVVISQLKYRKSQREVILHKHRRMHLSKVPYMEAAIVSLKSSNDQMEDELLAQEKAMPKLQLFEGEMLELIMPYADMHDMWSVESTEDASAFEFKTVGMAIYAWLQALQDYQAAYELYRDSVIRRHRLLRKIEEVSAERAQLLEGFRVLSNDLFWAKRKLDQLVWQHQRYIDDIQTQNNIIEKRGKYTVVLRNASAGDLLIRRSKVMVKHDNRIKNESVKLRERLTGKNASEDFLKLIVCRRNECVEEVHMAHNPWTWYDRKGQPWSEDKTHFEWYAPGQRCQARLRGWTRFFVGTIRDINVHKNGRRAACTIEFDDRDIGFDVDHNVVNILYPSKVSTAMALVNGDQKCIWTSFIHSKKVIPNMLKGQQAPRVLARMDTFLPQLLLEKERQDMLLEDAVGYYLRWEKNVRLSSVLILQDFFRCERSKRMLKLTLSLKAQHLWRVRKSLIKYKFKKHREKMHAFWSSLSRRVNASMEIQRYVRGYIARVRVTQLREEWRLEDIKLQAKIEARRVEVEFANRLRAKKKQAEFVSTWRCPRCPLKTQYSQRWSSMAEIELHKMTHMKEDELKFSKYREIHEKKEKERKEKLLKLQMKQTQMLAKLNAQTKAFQIAQIEQAKKKAIEDHKETVYKQTSKFNIEFSRPLLSGAKRRTKFYEQTDTDFHPSLLDAPFPLLRLVKDPRRKDFDSIYRHLIERIDITATPFRIGRGAHCDIRMCSHVRRGLLSKQHCMFVATKNWHNGGRYDLELADLHSTNGTFVNGARVSPGYDRRVPVRDGDLIVFGAFKGKSHEASLEGACAYNEPAISTSILPSELVYQLCCS